MKKDIEFEKYQKSIGGKKTKCPYCKAPAYDNYNYCDQCGKVLNIAGATVSKILG